MQIPKVLLIDDYLGLTDINGDALDRESLIHIQHKINDLLESEEGHLKSDGYVYFAKDVNGLIKIGCTNNFKNRKYGLNNKYGKMKLIRLISCKNMVNLERFFHIVFKDNIVTGEFFSLNESEVLKYELGYCESSFDAKDVDFNV